MSRTKNETPSQYVANVKEWRERELAQAESPGCDATAKPRPELTFDGWGINGPDNYRSRICTFQHHEEAYKYGPMFARAPETRAAAEALAESLRELMRVYDAKLAWPDTNDWQAKQAARASLAQWEEAKK